MFSRMHLRSSRITPICAKTLRLWPSAVTLLRISERRGRREVGVDAAIVVGTVVLILLAVAMLAFVAGRARGREILEQRELERALAVKVESVMSRPIVVTTADTTIGTAAEMMLRGGYGSLPVVDDQGRLVGIVTESDLTGTTRRGSVRVLAQLQEGRRGGGLGQLGKEPVSDVMNPNVVTARPDEPVSEVAERMVGRNVRHIPVIEGDIPVGMITRHDLLSQMVEDARDRRRPV
jgi:CBS domain-containing protein